jgi:hypothetical protein
MNEIDTKTYQVGELPRRQYRVALFRPRKMKDAKKSKVRLWMPYLPFDDVSGGNRQWIKAVCGIKSRPEYDKATRSWTIARSHFSELLDALLREFGPVDVFEDHSEFEVCNVSCMTAQGDECECRCLGINHGVDSDDPYNSPRSNWHIIDEDTGTVLATAGTKRVHYAVKPEAFKPISERVPYGFAQYHRQRYILGHGHCPICDDADVRLIRDHCHIHGWIRDEICSSCNIKLAGIERAFRASYREQGKIADIYQLIYPYELAQILYCPDCADGYDGSVIGSETTSNQLYDNVRTKYLTVHLQCPPHDYVEDVKDYKGNRLLTVCRRCGYIKDIRYSRQQS